MKKYCSHGHSPPSRCPAHRRTRKARNKAKALAGWETRRNKQAEQAKPEEAPTKKTGLGQTHGDTAGSSQMRNEEEVIALNAQCGQG